MTAMEGWSALLFKIVAFFFITWYIVTIDKRKKGGYAYEKGLRKTIEML